MQASANTHIFAKRSMALEPGIVAGIVIGVAALNALLAISWFILRARRSDNRVHRRHISAPTDVEKYEHSVAFAIATGAVPAARPLRGKEAARAADGKPYRDLILATQQHGQRSDPSSPMRLSRGSSRSSSDSAGLSKFVLRPQDINVKELNTVPKFPKKTKSPPQSLNPTLFVDVPSRIDLKRASHLTEASVYSSASAPPEYHDYLSRTQSFALKPPLPGSAPPWISHLPMPPAPAVVSNASSVEVFERVSSPVTSISEGSDTATIIPFRGKPSDSTSPSHSPSSVIFPTSPARSTTHSFVRSRTQSSPSAPPQVQWLTSAETTASPRHPRRPDSASSLSTIFSSHDSVVLPVAVVPLNIPHLSRDMQMGLVELTRSTPLPPARPARSDRRPAPTASMEHLPLTLQHS